MLSRRGRRESRTGPWNKEMGHHHRGTKGRRLREKQCGGRSARTERMESQKATSRPRWKRCPHVRGREGLLHTHTDRNLPRTFLKSG